MILSGQVSPDGKLYRFTNTGYTHHGLHIVDLATEKEIATFPLVQSWSGWPSLPMADASSSRVAPAIRTATSITSIAGQQGWKESSADRSSTATRCLVR